MNASVHRHRIRILSLSLSVFLSALLGYLTHPLSAPTKTTAKTKAHKSSTQQIPTKMARQTRSQSSTGVVGALPGRSESMLSLIKSAANRRQQKRPGEHRLTSHKPKSATAHVASSHGRNQVPARTAATFIRRTKASPRTHPAMSKNHQSPQQTQNLYWLSHAIQAEAGGEPWPTQVAVGDVIINRVRSANYPNTVKSVIFQVAYGHYAFSSVPNGWIYKTPGQTAIAAAKAVLFKHTNIVPSALVFYNSAHTSATNWVRSQQIIRVIGHMTFAR
jgi:spore germination cell wall hydrolase CwlJ-like protein